MMKRLISLVLTLLLILPALPLSVPAAAADTAVLESYDEKERAALIKELDEHGSVEAAMDAYARDTFEKYYQYAFDSMLEPSTNSFRQLAIAVEGTDDELWQHFGARFLLEIGYSIGERNFDFSSRFHQVQLYTNYLLALSDLEEIGFETVKSRARELTPEVDMGEELFQYALDLMSFGAGKLAGKAVNSATQLSDLPVANSTLEQYFFNMERLLGMHKTNLERTAGLIQTTIKRTGQLKKAVKLASPLTLKNLQNVTNAYEKAYGGLAMLDSMQWQNFDDKYFADAYSVLRRTYGDYLAALSQISAEDGLTSEELDKMFNTALQDNLFQALSEDADYSFDLIVLASSIGLEESLDLMSGKMFSIARKFLRLLTETSSNSISYLKLFHSISVLNEIYDQFAEANQNASPATWQDYITYAKNTRRMVCVACMGEEALYQMLQLDENATVKLWNLVEEALGHQRAEGYDETWYAYRTEAMQSLYDMTEEYIADLLEHYAALNAVVADPTGLTGHEDEVTCTLRGVLRQGEFFAKPDGSGEPDETKPNPDKGQLIEGLKVQLLAGETVIAETASSDTGAFVLTFDRALASGNPLTIRLGEKGGGDYAMKEIAIGAAAHAAFPASFGWDPLTQSPADAVTWAVRTPIIYSDEYFIDETSTTSREMLLMSLGLAAASMSRSIADGSISGTSGRDFAVELTMAQMGFEVLLTENYDVNLNTLTTEVPYAIGMRVGREFDADDEDPDHRIFVLAVGGDVDVPAMAGMWYKKGTLLDDAAAAIVQPLLQEVKANSHEGEVLHLWVTGFSWGGNVADRVCTRIRDAFRSAGLNVNIHLYTFGASGELSASGTHIAYEQDLIAMGMTRRSGRQQLLRNVAAGSAEQKVIASVFHQLSGGTLIFNPWWYQADQTLRDSLLHAHVDCERLDDLFATIAMWNFTNSLDGTDFRLNFPEDRKAALDDTLGVIHATASARMEDLSLDVLSYGSIPIFAAMPDDLGTEYQKIIQTILEADAMLSGNDQAYTLAERDKEALMALYLQAEEALHHPTSPYSVAFPHRPEMYLAWVLGASTDTLDCAEEGYLFNAELLPLQPNLTGTVLDKETREPLEGATVAITGGDDVNLVCTTDEKGYWEIYVDPDDYTLTFRHTGYKAKVEEVSAGMFGEEPIEMETLLEKTNLPLVTAKLGDFSHYDDDVFYDYEEIMKTKVKSLEEGVPAPDITLGLSEVQRRYTTAYDSIRIECGWLEPYTIPLPTEYDFYTNDGFGLMTGMYFDAADMGDGQYTYIVEMQGDYPICCTKVLILRESGQQLYVALDFTLLGDSTVYYGLDGEVSGFVDYSQAQASDNEYGFLRQSARFEQREDGAYDLVLHTEECDFHGGTFPVQRVYTRYRIVDGELTIVEQTVEPW